MAKNRGKGKGVGKTPAGHAKSVAELMRANNGGGGGGGGGGVAKKQKNRKGKSERQTNWKRNGGGNKPKGQPHQKGHQKELDKAIRRACLDSNLQMLLTSALLPEALKNDQTAVMVIETLVKHARLKEACALLRELPRVPLSFAHITAALLNLPQTTPIEAQDAADFVAAAVSGRSSFYQGQATAVLLEFVCEASSALEGIRGQSLDGLVRSGKTCVTARVSAGNKPAELHCDRDATSAAVDRERRGLQAGDCVAVSHIDVHDEGRLYEAEVAVGLPLILRFSSPLVAEQLRGASLAGRGGGRLRIDKLANRVSYKRQLAAITTVLESCLRAKSEIEGDSMHTKSSAAQPSAALSAAICGRSNGASKVSHIWHLTCATLSY